MKTLCSFLLAVSGLVAAAQTPFSYQFYNADGTAQTNPITMIGWPPATNTWTVYGSNIIYGGRALTLTPDTNGFGTNLAFPNVYRCYISNLGSYFFVDLPDSTNSVPLGLHLVDAPQTAGPIGFYGMITNLLGFAPATNDLAGIAAALGYTPLTNTYAAMTNAAGFALATNNLAGITAALGYTPLTNTYAAMTNAAGFAFATNPPLTVTTNLKVLVPGSTTNTLYITNGIVTKNSNP